MRGYCIPKQHEIFFSDEPINGFVDDYAFVIRGLLDLFTVCQDQRWIQWADELQRKQNELLWDPAVGGYFTAEAGDANILVRLKEGNPMRRGQHIHQFRRRSILNRKSFGWKKKKKNKKLTHLDLKTPIFDIL